MSIIRIFLIQNPKFFDQEFKVLSSQWEFCTHFSRKSENILNSNLNFPNFDFSSYYIIDKTHSSVIIVLGSNNDVMLYTVI